jgi:hypothetical protein
VQVLHTRIFEECRFALIVAASDTLAKAQAITTVPRTAILFMFWAGCIWRFLESNHKHSKLLNHFDFHDGVNFPSSRAPSGTPNAIFARSGSRLRCQELNGDYPGPVFIDQHGNHQPPVRTIAPAVAAKSTHRLKQQVWPGVVEEL